MRYFGCLLLKTRRLLGRLKRQNWLRKKFILPANFFYRYSEFGNFPQVKEIAFGVGKVPLIENAIVASPRGTYLLDEEHAVLNNGVRSHSESATALPVNHLYQIISLPYLMRRIRSLEGKFAVSVNVPANNHYHFLVDTLVPYLWARKHRPELQLLFNYELNPRYAEFLNLLELKFTSGHFEHKCESVLILPPFSDRTAEAFNLGVKILNALVSEKSILSQAANVGERRLFINRKPGKRSIRNNLKHILDKHSFTEIFLEDLPVCKQIQMLKNANRVLAVHGAGLANLIFAKKAEIYEIAPADPWGSLKGFGNGCFETLVAALDWKYQRLVGSQLINGVFEIDCELLDSELTEWLCTKGQNTQIQTVLN